MKKVVFNLFLFAVLVLGYSVTTAWAQKPLKGNWIFTVQTPMGALPVPFAFKSKGKGTVATPTGSLNMAYREKGANVSITLEGPGLAPDGSDLTIIVRGTKTDSTLTAMGIFVTDTADPSSPAGFAVVLSPVTGMRQ